MEKAGCRSFCEKSPAMGCMAGRKGNDPLRQERESIVAVARTGHPLPGCFHDGSGVLAAGFPAEDFPGLLGIGNQAGRVAFAARTVADGDFPAGDFFSRFQDFPDGKPQAGSQIEAFRGAALHQVVHRSQVGVRQVVDVDVVADAGAVRRIVIRAEDFDVFLFPGQREQDVGDEVGFRVVVFTDQAVLAAAEALK